MKVKLVTRDGRKVGGFFEAHKGKIFEVTRIQLGRNDQAIGYDVDLAPISRPGTPGWMYATEVEVVESLPQPPVSDWQGTLLKPV